MEFLLVGGLIALFAAHQANKPDGQIRSKGAKKPPAQNPGSSINTPGNSGALPITNPSNDVTISRDADGVIHIDNPLGRLLPNETDEVTAVSYDAGGNKIVKVGRYWYDKDGNVVANVPLLTREQIAAMAARNGANTDPAGDVMLMGVKKGVSTIPIVGPIIASNVVGSDPLSAADIQKNNQIMREQATIVVVRVDPGIGGSSGVVPVLNQLDPAVDDMKQGTRKMEDL